MSVRTLFEPNIVSASDGDLNVNDTISVISINSNINGGNVLALEVGDTSCTFVGSNGLYVNEQLTVGGALNTTSIIPYSVSYPIQNPNAVGYSQTFIIPAQPSLSVVSNISTQLYSFTLPVGTWLIQAPYQITISGGQYYGQVSTYLLASTAVLGYKVMAPIPSTGTIHWNSIGDVNVGVFSTSVPCPINTNVFITDSVNPGPFLVSIPIQYVLITRLA